MIIRQLSHPESCQHMHSWISNKRFIKLHLILYFLALYCFIDKVLLRVSELIQFIPLTPIISILQKENIEIYIFYFLSKFLRLTFLNIYDVNKIFDSLISTLFFIVVLEWQFFIIDYYVVGVVLFLVFLIRLKHIF